MPHVGEDGTCLSERKAALLEILVHVGDIGAVDNRGGRILEGIKPVGEPAEPLHLDRGRRKGKKQVQNRNMKTVLKIV